MVKRGQNMIILENNDLLELEELIKIESDLIKTGF